MIKFGRGVVWVHLLGGLDDIGALQLSFHLQIKSEYYFLKKKWLIYENWVLAAAKKVELMSQIFFLSKKEY